MKNNKVVKNASWIIGCRIAQAGFALLINMMTARYLGPSNYGILSYVSSMVQFVTPLMYLGINHVLVSEIVKYPDDEGKILGTSIVVTFFSAIFCIMGLLGFVIGFNPGERDLIIVSALYSLLLIAQSIELVQYWFQAKLLSKYVSLITLGAYLVVSTYKIWLLVTSKSIHWFAISNAFDYVLIGALLIAVYKTKKGQKFEFSYHIAKRILKQSWHYILPGMLGIILAQSDRIMLKNMQGNEAVGIYSAAYSIAGLSSFVFAAIIDSMKPEILSNKVKNEEKYKINVSKVFRIITYLSLLQCVCICFFSELIVWLMYGEAYLESVSVLKIIVWYTAFSYVGAVRSLWILAEEKQKYLWMVSFGGVIVNVGLNLVMIKVFGVCGAAVATLITQIFSNFLINYLIKPLREVNCLFLKGLIPRKLG